MELNLNVEQLACYFKRAYRDHYALNDGAHRESHFREVTETALAMNRALDLAECPRLITIVSWIHDLFAWERGFHHELSYRWVLGTSDPVITQLTPEERRKVAQACREHRASWRGDYSSTLSELMSSADRGMASTQDVYHRAYLFARDRHGLDKEQALLKAREHLVGKFGRGGYMRTPDIWQRYYGDVLEQRYQDIEWLAREDTVTLGHHINVPEG